MGERGRFTSRTEDEGLVGLRRSLGPILYSRRDVTATTRGESDYHFIINQRHTTFPFILSGAAAGAVVFMRVFL